MAGRGARNANRPSIFRSDDERARALEDVLLVLANNHRRQEERLDEVDYLEKAIKYTPPKFDGKEDPAVLEHWIRAMDKLVDAISCPENQRLKIAIYHLEGRADDWWQNVPDRNISYEEFKVQLRERFYPANVRKDMYEKFVSLRQGDMTVHEYYDKFIDLARFAPDLAATDRSKAQKFELGLTKEIQTTFGGQEFNSLHVVYTRAAAVEKVMGPKRRHQEDDSAGKRQRRNDDGGNFNHRHHNNNRNNNQRNGNKPPVNRDAQRIPPPCQRCNQRHTCQRCPGRDDCFRCGAPGHMAKDCHTRKERINLRADLANRQEWQNEFPRQQDQNNNNNRFGNNGGQRGNFRPNNGGNQGQQREGGQPQGRLNVIDQADLEDNRNN